MPTEKLHCNCGKMSPEEHLPTCPIAIHYGYCKKKETFEEDVACIRALLERLLMVLNNKAYLDYQLEKWGRIVTTKEVK